jgi:hypothetical protein
MEEAMLTSAEAWDALRSNAPRGEWMTIADVYAIVRANVALTPDDERAIAPSNRSERWKRTVRNALQRRKALGEVQWDGAGRYRL